MASLFGGKKNQQQPSNQIPVVQGMALGSIGGGGGGGGAYNAPFMGSNNNNNTNNTPMTTSSTEFNGRKGEPQPKQFNDVIFAIAFILHLLVMFYLLITSIGSRRNNNQNNNQNNNNNNNKEYDYTGVATCVITCGIFSVVVSTMALSFMMKFSTQLVKMALFFSIGMSLMVGIMGFLGGNMMMGVMGLISFALGCCYAYFVWDRIPFAAANLNTALTAVKSNLGLAIIAYLFLFIAFVWSIWWSVAAGGSLRTYGQGILFLFLLSYYWTHQVIQNTVHVTTAGVIGTWWFAPLEASSCCSVALKDSYIRATTYSFGSICFGSLIVALIQALRQMNHMLRDNEEFNFLVCIIDCILGCIESIIEYFNKWAYVYVGLYGYSYLDAGRNVITLFQNKGWSTIITDDLATNVLFMISVGIGLVSGLIGLLVAAANKAVFQGVGVQEGDALTVGFFIGLLTGFLLASILFSVVESAVNTVIVCFAEAPREFQTNHPELSNAMTSAWQQAWPGEYSG